MFNPILWFLRPPPSKEEIKQMKKDIDSDFNCLLDNIGKEIGKALPNYSNLTKARRIKRKQKQKSQKINKK